MTNDPLETLLRRHQLPNRMRATLWDVFEESSSLDDLESRLRPIVVSDDIKADLWDLKASQGPAGSKPTRRAMFPHRSRPYVARPEDFEVVSESGREYVGDPSNFELIDGKYLSTDPNFGAPLRGSGYLSFDPNAGEPLRPHSLGHTSGKVAPAAGGMAGGIIAGIPGAMAGGVAGQGAKTLIEHGAEIPGALADVARNIFTEPAATVRGWSEGVTEGAIDTAKAAGLEGVSQLAGNKLAQGGGKLAKWLMNRATTRVTEQLTREFPDLGDTLIDQALTVSKGGLEKAQRMLSAAKAKVNGALRTAETNGTTIPVEMTEDVAESLKTALLEETIRSRGMSVSVGTVTSARNRLPAHLRTLFGQIDMAVTNGTPLDLTPTHADLLKRRLQAESRALYRNRQLPNGPKAMGMGATERADFADQINTAIDTVATGYKAGNAQAKPLIGAVRGLKQAIRPSGNLYQAMVRPAVGAVSGEFIGQQQGLPSGTGALAGAVITSPSMMSREAIILRDPRVQGLLRQLPRASAAALQSLLSELSRTGAEAR